MAHLDSTWILLSSTVRLEVIISSPKVSHVQSIVKCTVTEVTRELMLVNGILHDSSKKHTITKVSKCLAEGPL